MRMDVNWVWLLLALGDGKISHPGFPGLSGIRHTSPRGHLSQPYLLGCLRVDL